MPPREGAKGMLPGRMILRRAPATSLRQLQLPSIPSTAERCFTAKARPVPPLKDVQYKLEKGIATIILDRYVS